MGCSASKPAPPGGVPRVVGYELTNENVSGPYVAEKGPYYVTRKNERRDILYAASGMASEQETPATTLSALFKKAAESSKNELALAVEWPVPEIGADGKVPETLPLDQWRTWTWGEYYNDSHLMARTIINFGAEKFDGICIFGFNSPFWVMSSMAAVLSSTLPAGIYPTDTREQIHYKLCYTDAAVAFCGTEDEFERIRECSSEAAHLKAIVCWACSPSTKSIAREDGTTIKVMTWDEAITLGKNQDAHLVDKRIDEQDPRECAQLVFTSGTTGLPKAVMLSHDNLTFTIASIFSCLPNFGRDTNAPERSLSYLPLSHIAGEEMDILLPVMTTASQPASHSVFFVRPYDLKTGTLVDRMRAVHPTAFLGVPRVYEKIMAKMKAKGAAVKGLKKKIVLYCKNKSVLYQRNLELGGSGKIPANYSFAEKTVLSKVKEALGLDQLKFALTGAAPMPREVQEYFASIGIAILDVYGASESTGGITGNSPQAHRFGTVGHVLPGSEVRIFNARGSIVEMYDMQEAPRATNAFQATEEEQGELCYRGRSVMMGYLANPKLGEEHVEMIEKKTADSIDETGWYHSGDKGACSVDNMFVITGRYKEIIIGAGGENIAPQPMENSVKINAPGIANAIMIGDQRKFNIMLITLRADGATGEFPGSDMLDPDVRSIGSRGCKSIPDAVHDEKWIAHIEQAIKAANADGAVCHNNAWKVQSFTILPYDVSIVGGELTPTLKLKRDYVDKKFKSVIDYIYDNSSTKSMYVRCPVDMVPPKSISEVSSVPEAKTLGTSSDSDRQQDGEPVADHQVDFGQSEEEKGQQENTNKSMPAKVDIPGTNQITSNSAQTAFAS